MLYTFNKVEKASEFSSKGLGWEEVVKEIIMKIDWTTWCWLALM